MPEHTVEQGECISSIADGYGFFWETVWQHSDNTDLRVKRGDPNVLMPGDVVAIPEKEEKQEDGATEKRHCFRRKGVPAKLILRIMHDPAAEDSPDPGITEPDPWDEVDVELEDADLAEPKEEEPMADVPYTLEIDGTWTAEGKTDADGYIRASIPPGAKHGNLRLNPGTEEERVLTLQLGNLDPITEIAGLKRRLYNLGYDCGDFDDTETAELQAALRAFQEKQGLEPTGEPDQDTRDALEEAHGS